MTFTFANGIQIYSEDNSVGLNVTTPRRTMDINGTLGVSSYIFLGTTDNSGLNNQGKILINTTDDSVSFYNNSTDGMVIPVGTNLERVNITGAIRYNTDTLSFEGYNGNWGSLGGVKDVDQDTYISAETLPGDDNDELKFYTAGSERMRIDITGNIGLGTTAVNGKLEIAGDYGSLVLTNNSYGELTSTGFGYGDAATNSYSIYANGKIAASEFNAHSDKRVKEILNERPIEKDLEYLDKVKIYDFKYIDKKFYSSRTKVGYMAQELEEYNKNLVNYSTNFIPNIFKEFDVRTVNKEHIIELDNDYDIKENDLIKIQIIKSDGDHKMKELVILKKVNKLIYLSYSKNLSEVTRVFLYGKLVNDFRTVNWEQLIAINNNLIKHLKKENTELKEKVSNNELQIQYLIERLNKLENPVEEYIPQKQESFNFYT